MTLRAPDDGEVLGLKCLHPPIKIDYRGLHSQKNLMRVFLDIFWKIVCHPDHTFAFIVSGASLINLLQPSEVRAFCRVVLGIWRDGVNPEPAARL